jgi:dephospho-CoA kinase
MKFQIATFISTDSKFYCMKVIGLTGTIGSGKEMVKEYITKRFSSWYVHLSSMITGDLEKKKISFDRKKMQDVGNELRKQYGSFILAKLAVSYMQRDKEILIVDGIRNPGEVDFLRKTFGRDFLLIAVDAPQQMRFERIKQRGRKIDPKTFEEFVALDERDQGKGEPEYGQQTAKCRAMADVVIMNDGTAEDLVKKMEDIFHRI